MRLRTSLAVWLGTVLIVITGTSVSLAQSDQPMVTVPPPTSSATPDQITPFVPVSSFWASRRDISLDEVEAAIEGRHTRYRQVVIATDRPELLWDALGVEPSGSVAIGSPRDVKRAVEHSRRVLGLVPAAQVSPTVRALSVDGLSLFGGRRLQDIADWPLLMAGSEDSDFAPFDPAMSWTLAAAGDVMLDREPYRQAVILKKGPDYPWDGGYAEITSRTCCTVDGGPAIGTRRRGQRGAVRELLSGADIAIVNHEAPAPDDARYHPSGLTFSVDPALLQGVADVGIDIVSLANNHIRNAGSGGVMQTRRNLRKVGVRTVGAGRDPRQAREPACFDVREMRVCFLAYDAINTAVHAARTDRPGAAELIIKDAAADIHALRADGADVIAVVPHWGPEYVTSITAQQRRWARAMVAAGADVVLGSHSHVTGPLEFIRAAPVLYSMGDFIFDLPRFEQTEEGVIAELTFNGPDLLQLELHPTVIVDRSQVNLLDRAGDGRVVLRRMRKASEVLR